MARSTGQIPPRRSAVPLATPDLGFLASTAAMLENAVTRPVTRVYARVSDQLQMMLAAVLTHRLSRRQRWPERPTGSVLLLGFRWNMANESGEPGRPTRRKPRSPCLRSAQWRWLKSGKLGSPGWPQPGATTARARRCCSNHWSNARPRATDKRSASMSDRTCSNGA